MMNKCKNILLALTLIAMPLSALAVSKQDVEFAQRQCQQRNDYAKCQTARDMMRTYQMEQRDRLEHDAAVRANQRMEADRRVYIEQNNYYGGDNRGGYKWNSRHNKYCNHNSNGSVYRCYN